MKKTLVIAAVALAGLLVSNCQKEAAETSRNINIALGNSQDSAKVDIDVPTYADQNVNIAIMEQMSEQFGGTYEGDYADCDSFARFCAQRYMDEMKNLRDEFEDFDMGLPFERSLTVKKGYETDKLVTYNVQTYEFSGGAHGGTASYGLTFRKSDGRLMGENTLLAVRPDAVEWNEMLKHGLMEYFEVKNETDLEACLQGVEIYDIPMPACGVSYGPNGMDFVYQQYEVACYAAGLPSFTIPYDKLKPCLNVTGRRLVEE